MPRDRVLGARRDVQTPVLIRVDGKNLAWAPASPRHERISPEHTSQDRERTADDHKWGQSSATCSDIKNDTSTCGEHDEVQVGHAA